MICVEFKLREAADGVTRSERVARDDAALLGEAFGRGTRPLLRWIKGDGLDDRVTRAAVGQATRLFGNRVDYCLCSYGLDAGRVRDVLAWADQPVEWIGISEEDNERLAAVLHAAGCATERFGYWWKWFPERVRPNAPEWILDGDMVVTGIPPWFDDWAAGRDVLRVSQDDRSVADGTNIYGAYEGEVDRALALYSGLVSLPPGLTYIDDMLDVVCKQPLTVPHDGVDDMSEQGVVAAAFQRHSPVPIPLSEFPFGRAFEEALDFGLVESDTPPWGYHFGNAFRMPNPHFEDLQARGVVFADGEPSPCDDEIADREGVFKRYRWLGGGAGQWGVPGWEMPEGCVRAVLEECQRYQGRRVLDLGTSRGRLAGSICALGCQVTTVDRVDRGAKSNLAGLPIEVVLDDAVHFLETTDQRFDLICVDLHGNTPADWRRYAPGLLRCLARHGELLVSNVELWKIPEWADETGAQKFVNRLRWSWRWRVRPIPSGPPGMAIAKRR